MQPAPVRADETDAERAIETALRSGNPGWLAAVVADRVHLWLRSSGWRASVSDRHLVSGRVRPAAGDRVAAIH
jgi:hypothetical protein